MKQKSFGFSLSEVLITLGVIGVVAAITLPVVINKTQTHILKNQYKRVYSNYSNALQKYIVDNSIPDCYYGKNGISSNYTGCSEFFQDFMQYFKYIKYCESNAFSNGCIPKYDSYCSKDGGCLGFSEDRVNTESKAWVLNDGSSFICYNANSKTCSMPLFQVDINGKKAPNKGSYDLVAFSISRYGDTLKLDISSCVPYSEGAIVKGSDISGVYK